MGDLIETKSQIPFDPSQQLLGIVAPATRAETPIRVAVGRNGVVEYSFPDQSGLPIGDEQALESLSELFGAAFQREAKPTGGELTRQYRVTLEGVPCFLVLGGSNGDQLIDSHDGIQVHSAEDIYKVLETRVTGLPELKGVLRDSDGFAFGVIFAAQSGELVGDALASGAISSSKLESQLRQLLGEASKVGLRRWDPRAEQVSVSSLGQLQINDPSFFIQTTVAGSPRLERDLAGILEILKS